MAFSDVEPVVMADARIDPFQFMLQGVDTSEKPTFNVGELAKVFFARGSHWVRWRETLGHFVLDGSDQKCEHKVPDPSKPGKFKTAIGDDHTCSLCGGISPGTRTSKGARKYSLGDVERVAHALAQRGHINGTQLRHTLTIVRTISELYGYL